ncbi:efflux RND transporter periplasmic adaptor subunit [Flavisphingomonas formosensis]|uniref:efflux RND transporter periplasmic adaptor subunit n=1 Tax=Flavisphingomonas formosensis TaxID=861534 RepID=UPI0012FA65CF|nr:efflux RND transporter periplasmic adaptor subunit [Sphingomonas formosensis]
MTRYFALLPLLALAACGSGGGADEGEKAEPVALVRTAPVEQGATATQMLIYGTAEAGPGGERSLVAPAEALVDRILAPNGTQVAAGQAIVTLRPSRTTATEIARAAADAVSSSAAFARARRMRADGLASDADVETARATAETARATLANLGMSRAGTVVRAPIAGIVQGLNAKSGDQVAAGASIASIAAKGDLRAHFGIDPAAAQRVRPGQPLELDSVNGDGHASLTVTGVDAQVDPTTRLASIYARVPQGFGLSPGEAVRGELSLSAEASGLTIPYSALLDDGGKSYVFVVEGGVAHQRQVSPGNSSGDRIGILKGVAAGDKVVTEGGTALEDGMKVREQ